MFSNSWDEAEIMGITWYTSTKLLETYSMKQLCKILEESDVWMSSDMGAVHIVGIPWCWREEECTTIWFPVRESINAYRCWMQTN